MQGNVEGKLRTHFYDADYIGSEIPEKNQNLIGIAILHNNEAKIVPRALSDFETITSIELYAQKISIFGGKQTICIDKSNLSTGNISVYSISGQLIKHSEISEKFSAINIYKRGTYIAVYSENGLVIKKQKVQVQ
jgi:hypothetical protein